MSRGKHRTSTRTESVPALAPRHASRQPPRHAARHARGRHAAPSQGPHALTTLAGAALLAAGLFTLLPTLAVAGVVTPPVASTGQESSQATPDASFDNSPTASEAFASSTDEVTESATATDPLDPTADPTDPTATAGPTDPTATDLIDPTVDPTATAGPTDPTQSAGPTDNEAPDSALTVAAMCGAAIPTAVYAAPGETGMVSVTWRHNGEVIRVDRELSPQGSSPWPGVTFDADGQPIGWPGWTVGADGEWSFDSAQAALTRGMSVEVVWTPEPGSGAADSVTMTADLEYPMQFGPVGADVPCGPPVAYYGGGAGSGAGDGAGGDVGESTASQSTGELGSASSPVTVTVSGGALAATGGEGLALLSVAGVVSLGVGACLLVIGFRPRRRPARRH